MKARAFSLSHIALENLRRRRRECVLLAVSVVLAIYFISTVLLLGFGTYTSLEERYKTDYGQQDRILFNCGDAPLTDLLTEGTFSVLGKAQALADVVDGGQQRLFSIASYDDTARTLSYRRLKRGEYPARAGEIALEQYALSLLNLQAQIGDSVTLSLRVPDGEGGFLAKTTEKTYTLTGILYNQDAYRGASFFDSAYMDLPAGMVSSQERVEPGGRAVIMAFGNYRPGGGGLAALNDFCQRYDVQNPLPEETVFSGTDEEGYKILMNGGFAAVIGLVLVAACCLGIINAFSATLENRRRQIGLLRAVGATRRQIRSIFGRETLLLSLIALPLGLGLAIGSVFLIFFWLGEGYVLVLNPWVILGVATLGPLCILTASAIPLRRAASVSPMYAIRQVDTLRRVGKETLKSRTDFDASRLIASRSRQIYRHKQMGISAALAIGILASSLAGLFVNVIIEGSNDSFLTGDYRLAQERWPTGAINYGFHDPGLTEGDKQSMGMLPLVEKTLGEKRLSVQLLPEKITPYATGDGWWEYGTRLYTVLGEPRADSMRSERVKYRQIREQYYGGKDYLSVFALALEEEVVRQLEPYVYEGTIDLDKLRSGQEVLVAAPKEYSIFYEPDEAGNPSVLATSPVPGYTYATLQTNDMFHAGDTVMVSFLCTDAGEDTPVKPEEVVKTNKMVTIGAVLDLPNNGDNRLDIYGYPEFMDVITTLPGLEALGIESPYLALSVRLSQTPDRETERYLNDALGSIAERIKQAELFSRLEYTREIRSKVVQALLFGAGVFLLTLAISVSMISNVLSAHIRAEHRGIGTLRAVGMDGRDIFCSYFYQLFPLFAWGGAIGLALSLTVGYRFVHMWEQGALGIALLVGQPLGFVLLVIGVCAWNIAVRLRAILRESITENIREL